MLTAGITARQISNVMPDSTGLPSNIASISVNTVVNSDFMGKMSVISAPRDGL